MVRFFCFKWGDKYGPEYVNRLRNSLKIYCKVDFEFVCVTDDPYGIAEDIRIIPIYTFQTHGSSVFTSQKLELMYWEKEGTNIILDLDILIHNDITPLVNRENDRPTFIYTHWTPQWHWEKLIIPKKACFVNSSCVRWEGDQGAFLYEHFASKWIEHHKEYDSCDKYIFYEHMMPHYFSSNPDDIPIDFWPEKCYYNYNEPGPWQYRYNPEAIGCLFNTSHLIKLDRRHYELDNTPTEHTDIWESYDDPGQVRQGNSESTTEI